MTSDTVSSTSRVTTTATITTAKSAAVTSSSEYSKSCLTLAEVTGAVLALSAAIAVVLCRPDFTFLLLNY